MHLASSPAGTPLAMSLPGSLLPHRLLRWLTGALAAALLLAAAALGQAPSPAGAPPMAAAAGPAAVTLYPVRLAGAANDRVTETVALLLEKRGLETIELGPAAPDVPPGADLAGLAAAVAAFVKGHPPATGYAVYAEIDGSRQRGLDGIRTVLADRAGTVVWSERLGLEDQAFKALEAREPLTLAILMVERLGPRLGLTDETARKAKPGKYAALMEQRSGLPPADERAPLPERRKRMNDARPATTLTVFPARVRGAADPSSAAAISLLLNDAKLFAARPAAAAAELDAPTRDPNEMKRLWDFARSFRTWVKAHPPETDYALCADYAFDPDRPEAGFVHLVVCDRKGDWVAVEMRNSHHPGYQAARPTSRPACDRLLLSILQ